MSIIEVKDLSKTFITKDAKVEALKNINFSVEAGDIYGIIGMSGAGKSTLVRCLNFLEVPTEGTVTVEGQELGKLAPKELRKLRASISMIFQGFNLLMQRTVIDNISFPLTLQKSKLSKQEIREKAEKLLAIVGLSEKANAYPAQLSGGQKQRVAIARAMINDPAIILADEPTGALDSKTGHLVMDLFHRLHEEQGKTIVLITHSKELAQETQRIITLSDGNIVGNADNPGYRDVVAKRKAQSAGGEA